MNIETLVRRYQKHYNVKNVTAEQVLYHWDSERRLRGELLAAPAEHRWQIFDEGYSRHYRDMTWLKGSSEPSNFQEWLDLVGTEPKKIFEIGSGKGALIKALAAAGHDCTATEITRERGACWVEETNIRWHTTDGVHLDQHEPAGTYDIAISNQVIEHMHPDDLQDHFRGVHAILNEKGTYLIATPHRYMGPCDVSSVFGSSKCEGQHLKEYTYKEIAEVARAAGFRVVAGSIRFPHFLRPVSKMFAARLSPAYLQYLEAMEAAIGVLPSSLTKPVSQLARAIYFRPTIYMSAHK